MTDEYRDAAGVTEADDEDAYLTEDELFCHGPAGWLEWQTDSWMHRGHVGRSAFNAQIDKQCPYPPLVPAPYELEHLWLRFPVDDLDPENDPRCRCEWRGNGDGLRWEEVSPTETGARPVTVGYVWDKVRL